MKLLAYGLVNKNEPISRLMIWLIQNKKLILRGDYMKSNSEIASENLKKHTAELLQVLDDTLKITITLDWLAEKLDKKKS